jgi:TDG/mug DNA glycosylase family protein
MSAPDPAPTILPDVLHPGLALVICGSAAGRVSALRGAYYAGPGNRFWTMLAETGLTPRRLLPAEFGLLSGFGIGLTDLAKHVSGADADLPSDAYDPAGLAIRIRRVRPGILAFNGKQPAAAFLCRPTGSVPFGWQAPLDDFPPVFVLPSSSAAARRSWDARPWHELARACLPRGGGGLSAASEFAAGQESDREVRGFGGGGQGVVSQVQDS